MKKTYVVTFRVDGCYKVLVETEETDLEMIKQLAENEFTEADFGELQDVDGYSRMVEEFDTEDILWNCE